MIRSTLFLLLLLITSSVSAQVFQLYEMDLYTKNKDTPPIKNGQYADINSTLYITIDKTAIAESIRNFTGTDTISTQILEDLTIVLHNQVEIMKKFEEYAADPTLTTLNNLAAPINTFFMEADNYPDVQKLFNQYSDQYIKDYTVAQRKNAGKDGVPYLEEYVFVQLSKKAEELAKFIENGIGEENVNFILAGKMTSNTGSRDIKLSDDFDNIAASSYTVSRWQTQLTEEGQKQMEQIGQLSTSLNNLMQANSADIKNFILSSFGADDCLKDVEARLKTIPQTVATVAPELENKIIAVVEAPYKQARALVDKYTTSISTASTINTISLLEGFSSTLSGTADSIETMVSNIDSNVISVLKDIPNNPEIAAFITTYNACKDSLISDKNKILNIAHRLSSIFSTTQNAADAASSISDKVKRLSFNTIPDESYIDLTNTGQRANGDKITILAVLEQQDSTSNQTTTKTIDRRIFRVQQIGLYSRVRPLLLLANPRGEGPNIDLANKRFQFAPSYSVLFKFGSRTSKAFNEIWQPSIGVNFGALDFNTDAVPEFSTALEFTFLKDYFSFGYGYNFGADADYFMVGFRIPVGTLPLPMFNNIESTEGLD